MEKHIEPLQQNNLLIPILPFKQDLNKEIDATWESFMSTVNISPKTPHPFGKLK